MSEVTQEQKIGEFVLWLEAGNGNNLMQSVCSAIINQADAWYESKLAYEKANPEGQPQ